MTGKGAPIWQPEPEPVVEEPKVEEPPPPPPPPATEVRPSLLAPVVKDCAEESMALLQPEPEPVVEDPKVEEPPPEPEVSLFVHLP